jgi:hypothetical protein
MKIVLPVLKKTFLPLLKKACPLLFFLSVSQGAVRAQSVPVDKKTFKIELGNLLESRNYTFVALSIMPMAGGGTHQLTAGDYSLVVTKGPIISQLPYFGTGYSAPADPTKAGIQFTSTDFDYTTTARKKGWEVLIKLKDNKDIQRLSLDIADNGYATLHVVSTEKQPVSYYGAITVSTSPK